MSEETGEMPNPLNPNNNPLDANPAESQPLENVVQEVQAASATPAENPAADPMARPMEKAPEAEPVQPKKKKTGLIIGGIIAAVVAIGCGVAAAIIFALNSGDPVVKAIEKIAAGKMPAYAVLDGSVTVTPNDDDSVITSVKIDLNSQTSTTSMLNDTKATVTMGFASEDEVDFGVEEIYSANGDLFLKLENVSDAIEGFAEAVENSSNYNNTVDCIEDEDGDTACDEESFRTLNTTESLDATSTLDNSNSANALGSVLGSFGGVIELVDNQWLKVSMDEINELTGGTGISMNEKTTCLVGVLSNIDNYKNSTAQIYNNNAFISSTTEGVTLASKTGQPVRKVVVDKEKFNSFSNAMKDSELVKDLSACSEINSGADKSSSLGEFPTVYVEVDKDYNFSRVAFEAPITSSTSSTTSCVCDDPDDCPCDEEEEEDTSSTMSVDFSISYPDTINVAEPSEYKDLSTLIQELFTMMYSTQGAGTDYSNLFE